MKAPLLLLFLTGLAGSSLMAGELSKRELARQDQISRTLNQVVIPKLDLRGVYLEDAVKIVVAEIRRLDPHHRGVPILLEVHPRFGPEAPATPPEGAPMTLYSSDDTRFDNELTDIPAFELLRYLAGSCGARLDIRSDGVHIGMGTLGPTITRELPIPADFFPAFEREDQLCHTEQVAEMRADFARYLFRPLHAIPYETRVILSNDATHLTVHSTREKIAEIQSILKTDRPASAFPVPGPKVPKVIEGPPRDGISDWRKAETDTARKLRTIQLPSLTLNNTLYEAGALLSEMSKRYDTEQPPTKRGVVIRAQIQTGAPENPFYVVYSARHISLLDAVQDIADLKLCSVDMDEYGVQWIPFGGAGSCWTRTYLVSPTTAAQWANGPVPWLKEAGINSLPNVDSRYIAKRHYLIVRCSVGQHKTIEQANDKAWREYYASEKAKTLKEP